MNMLKNVIIFLKAEIFVKLHKSHNESKCISVIRVSDTLGGVLNWCGIAHSILEEVFINLQIAR